MNWAVILNFVKRFLQNVYYRTSSPTLWTMKFEEMSWYGYITLFQGDVANDCVYQTLHLQFGKHCRTDDHHHYIPSSIQQGKQLHWQ